MIDQFCCDVSKLRAARRYHNHRLGSRYGRSLSSNTAVDHGLILLGDVTIVPICGEHELGRNPPSPPPRCKHDTQFLWYKEEPSLSFSEVPSRSLRYLPTYEDVSAFAISVHDSHSLSDLFLLECHFTQRAGHRPATCVSTARRSLRFRTRERRLRTWPREP